MSNRNEFPTRGYFRIKPLGKATIFTGLDGDSGFLKISCALPIAKLHQNFMYIGNIPTLPKIQISLLAVDKSSIS